MALTCTIKPKHANLYIVFASVAAAHRKVKFFCKSNLWHCAFFKNF